MGIPGRVACRNCARVLRAQGYVESKRGWRKPKLRVALEVGRVVHAVERAGRLLLDCGCLAKVRVGLLRRGLRTHGPAMALSLVRQCPRCQSACNVWGF